MSKGSQRRPRQISREEEDLRWAFAYGKIDREDFEREMLRLKDKEKKQ